MNDHPDDRFDELMRRALAEEADRIEPADGLHEIQARVRDQRKPVNRRPWALAVGAAVVGTAAAVGAFTLLDDNTRNADQPEVAGSPSATASATIQPSTEASAGPSALPTSMPSAKPSQTINSSTEPPKTVGVPEAEVKARAVPVYWVGRTIGNDTGAGVRLYRTFTRISGRPTLEAVRTMTSEKSSDPDYYSPWIGSAVNSVTKSGDLVTVDFKLLPREKLDPAAANIATQQLVYTVQAVLGDSSQQILVTEQGQATRELFGQALSGQPLSRAQAMDVQALVWIESPEQKATVRSPVTVRGTAAAYEATVNWQATNLKTKTVVKNYTNTQEGMKFSPFTFTTKLAPGEWQLEVFMLSGEDGHITDTDSKTIFVK
ncbi:sporulation and spore germination protein [Kribbella orskensis]|uniref:Sporulation and spore germination protein n=1 Tax=Kribbella orskensis TaxID=2512216 RepID=A0ABY2BBS0_9ACTN|nr:MULTISPECIES: Gmad2 immunoglobulin-like domain-containing protein [Kribbella]TCN34266.1 sporulation and spore germination protein [Kribbella sp. VKM Ac-2500]TCO14428.1 sporulation and spore germination protein [Kribbella orskensis]